MKDNISIILKISNACNLKCKHCYEGDNSNASCSTVMPLDILSRVFELAQNEYKHVTYVWFGGEPLLCGLDYLKEAISLQQKYGQGTMINNRMQTNATLVTRKIASFLFESEFMVSVSYDGQFNDFLRQETSATLKGIKHLKEAGHHCGILSTIHSSNVAQQIEMYEHIKEMGCPMKFNPIFPSGNATHHVEFLLDDTCYISETMRFFRYWCHDNFAVPVANFIQSIKLITGYPERHCTNGQCFYHWLCVEPDGGITPCSRFFSADYRICSLEDITSFEQVYLKDSYAAIVAPAIIRRQKCKKHCELYPLCNGGCNSAAANEVGLENAYFQQCRLTKKLLPLIINEIESIKQNSTIPNKIVSALLSHSNISSSITE